MKKHWIVITISLAALFSILITTLLFMKTRNSESNPDIASITNKSTSKQVSPSTTLASLTGYYIGVKKKEDGEVNYPVVIAYISSSDSSAADYFSFEKIDENNAMDMSFEVDKLSTNQELIDKTFSNLRRYNDRVFTSTMFDKKDGNKLVHDALIYLPVVTQGNLQILLSLENDNDDQPIDDYLFVKTSEKNLKALGQVSANDLNVSVLRDQFGLFDFDSIAKVAFRQFVEYSGPRGLPITS